MEEYKNYVRHKSLENIMSLVFMVFIIMSIFIVGKTIGPEQKYVSAHAVSIAEAK